MAGSARDIILDAAERTFAERGFSGASMKGISDMAGVSKSLLYHHFESKRLLWDEVVCRRVTDSALHERIRRTVSMLTHEGVESVRKKGGHRGYFDFLKENPGLVRMMAWLNAERSISLGGPPKELITEVIGDLSHLQEKGVFRKDVDPRMFVVFFMAVCEYWFISRDKVAEWFGPGILDDSMDDEYISAAGRVLLTGMTDGGGRG